MEIKLFIIIILVTSFLSCKNEVDVNDNSQKNKTQADSAHTSNIDQECLKNIEPSANGFHSYDQDTSTYLICTLEQLKQLSNIGYVAHNYKLGADFNLAGVDFKPIAYLAGSFDGNYHEIKNFTLDKPDKKFQGFFQEFRGSFIRNLKFTNFNVTAHSYSGALVGSVTYGKISNIDASGSFTVFVDAFKDTELASNVNQAVRAEVEKVTGQTNADTSYGEAEYIGGLIGTAGPLDEKAYSFSGSSLDDLPVTLENINYDITFSAHDGYWAMYLGSLVGAALYTNIKNVHGITRLKNYAHESWGFGGMFGALLSSHAENVSVEGKVEGMPAINWGDYYFSDGAGLFSGEISESYIKDAVLEGEVWCPWNTGLFAGQAIATGVENLVAQGYVSHYSDQANPYGYAIGGFIGDIRHSDFVAIGTLSYPSGIKNSTFTGTIVGTEYTGGAIGKVQNSGSVTASVLENVVIQSDIYTDGDALDTGGLVGNVSSSEGFDIINSNFNGTITGHTSVGGAIGNVQLNNIAQLVRLDNVKVDATISSDRASGGLIGNANASLGHIVINNSNYMGDISGNSNIGGLVGFTESSTNTDASDLDALENTLHITDSYAHTTISIIDGDLVNPANFGGIVGNSKFGIYTNSMFSGTFVDESSGVSTNIGTVVGLDDNTSPFITNGVVYKSQTGIALGIGCKGSSADPVSGCIALSNVQLSDEATMQGIGWDFTATWFINSTTGLPDLQ